MYRTDTQYWRKMIFLKFCTLMCLTAAVKIVDQEYIALSRLDISKYCPNMNYCIEGTHILCQYYNAEEQKIKMGRLCVDGKNIPISPEIQQLLLDLVNEFRAALASGTETGRDGEPFGQAFGINELEWDETLAFFATIWANQCTLKRDLCRATDIYHDPGQMVSVMRFTFPDWKLWVPSTGRTFPDEDIKELTENKVIYSIENIMREAYFKKDYMTREMLVDAPDFNEREHLSPLVGYMTMINADTTHMGCGLTAFVDYHIQNQAMEEVVTNSVLLVCNFSENPRAGTNLIKPRPEDGSEKCGCPPDTDESERCLCIPRTKREIVFDTDHGKQDMSRGESDHESNICDADDPACRGSVVILPIVTMENAPSSELLKPEIDEGTGRRGYQRRDNIFYSSEDHSFEHGLLHSETVVRKGNTETRRSGHDASNDHIDKLPLISDRKRNGENFNHRESLPNGMHHHKESIFTRVSKFELPSPNKHNSHSAVKFAKNNKTIKNSTSLKATSTAYTKKQRTENNKYDNLKFGIAGFNSTPPKNYFEIKKDSEETDHKLLKLLDNLEEEVKHVRLNNNIKQRINARIRRFYGNFLDDHSNFIKAKAQKYSPQEKVSNYVMQNKFPSYEIDDDVLEHTALQKRQQNSLAHYDYPIYEHYDIFEYNDSPYNNFGKSYDNDDERRDKYNYLDETNVNNYYDEEDRLRAKKRKYYQQKLDNIERKLKSMRGYNHRNEKEGTGHSRRLFRPVLSHGPESPTDHIEPYLPQRAKYIHSY